MRIYEIIDQHQLDEGIKDFVLATILGTSIALSPVSKADPNTSSTQTTMTQTPSVTEQGYATVDEAAKAALRYVETLPRHNRIEYIGLIWQDPSTGKYLFTEATTTGDNETSEGTFTLPKGSLRAMYHNHPRRERGILKIPREYFSDIDINMAAQSGLVSYISCPDGVKKWDPRSPGKILKSYRGNDVILGIGQDVN